MSGLNLCVIGAGGHSRHNHLPALSRFMSRHPGEIAVGGVCDPVQERAREAAGLLSGCRPYAEVEAMLDREQPQACIVLTPVALNAAMAMRLLQRGIPVLMEKPLGASIEEARELVRCASGSGTGAMVSMNRRFDPLLERARAWIGTRQVRYIRATMARHNRSEPAFLFQTGLHLIDVLRMLAGEVSEWKAWMNSQGGGRWIQLRLEFGSGVHALVDFLPTAGGNAESVEFFGEGFRVDLQTSGFQSDGWRVWTDGKMTVQESHPSDLPEFIANGTYAETEAFIAGLRTGVFSPTPAEVLPGMELCEAINAELGLLSGSATA